MNEDSSSRTAAAVNKSKVATTSTRPEDGRAANGDGQPASDTSKVPLKHAAVTFSFRFSEGQVFGQMRQGRISTTCTILNVWTIISVECRYLCLVRIRLHAFLCG